MINKMIDKINELESKDLYVNLQTEKGKYNIIVSTKKDSYSIELSTSVYDTNKMQLSLSIKYEKFNFLVDAKDMEPFINTIRESLENSWFSSRTTKEKREELMYMFRQAHTIGVLQKEQIEQIEANEQKQYFFRMITKDIEHKNLEEMRFFHVHMTELTRDKRIPESAYVTKDYELVVTSRELCEIFNINLKEEKETKFKQIFKDIIVQPEQVIVHEDKKEIEENLREKKEEDISKKIKKFL